MGMPRWVTFAMGAAAVLLGFAGAAFFSPEFAVMMLPGFGLILIAALTD